ncbi:MAG: DUF2892 domain-containing protein [Solirubrobacteraceae bacterium]|nr:DUF2892 domain-containing protein [Solirubrobacteraceae bacterium]
MSASPLSSPAAAPACSTRWARGWTLERVLFAMAGTMTAVSALLAALVSPWFLLLTAFVAVNQLVFALVGDCAASLVLRRVARLTAANDG